MTISVFDRIEKIVGEGENTGNQHFVPFPQCFQSLSLSHENPGLFWRGLIKVSGKSFCISHVSKYGHYRRIHVSQTQIVFSSLLGECNTILSAYKLYRHLE